MRFSVALRPVVLRPQKHHLPKFTRTEGGNNPRSAWLPSMVSSVTTAPASLHPCIATVIQLGETSSSIELQEVILPSTEPRAGLSSDAADHSCCCCCEVASVVSDSVQPHRRQPTRLLCPWDSPGKNLEWVAILQYLKGKSESEVAQSCPTPSDPMDCNLPGPSIHGIFQARLLEWGAIAFSRSFMTFKEIAALRDKPVEAMV